MKKERREMYRSPLWTLSIELFLSIQAMIVGYSGSDFARGSLHNVVFSLNENMIWFTLFVTLGFGLFVTSITEWIRREGLPMHDLILFKILRLEDYPLSPNCRHRFATVREGFNLVLLGCWSYALVAVSDDDVPSPLITLVSIQAIVFHFLVFIENVKSQKLPFEDKRDRRNNSMDRDTFVG